MTKWYYVTPQKTHQEFSDEEASGLIQSGAIQPSTLIWNESMADWKPASEVSPQWFGGASSAGSQAASTSTPSTAAPDLGGGQVAPPLGGATSGAPAAGGVSQHVGSAGGVSTQGGVPTLPQNDPLAQTSMISGIAGAVLTILSCVPIIGACFGILAFVGAVTAIITGHMSLSHLKKAGDGVGGRQAAMTGLICGYIVIGLVVLGIIAAIVFGAFSGMQSASDFDNF